MKTPSGKRVTFNTSHCFESTNEINGYGWKMSWETMKKDYLVDDSLFVKATVKITKMIGIPRKKLKSFDESVEEFSDVILAVEDEKFYVLKKFLASHSSYFKSLFFGSFAEAEKSEITLSEINSAGFQCLLEVLYGESAIDDENVDGILHLAHMNEMAFVIRKCEECLLDKSDRPSRCIFKIAKQYQLEFKEIMSIENQNNR